MLLLLLCAFACTLCVVRLDSTAAYSANGKALETESPARDEAWSCLMRTRELGGGRPDQMKRSGDVLDLRNMLH